jgi:hypothetical protein
MSFTTYLKKQTIHGTKTLTVGGQLVIGFVLTKPVGLYETAVFSINEKYHVSVEYCNGKPVPEHIQRLEAYLILAPKAENVGYLQLLRGQFGMFDPARFTEQAGKNFFSDQLIDNPDFENLNQWNVTAYFAYGTPYLVLENKLDDDIAFQIADRTMIRDVAARYNVSVRYPNRITIDTQGFHNVLDDAAFY